jgi:Cu/Ag efflux protein CusF
MKKVIVILMFALFAVVGFTVGNAIANGQEKTAVAPKESRWHGVIVRINKDASTMDVRRGTFEKKIHWDSSTKWTKGTKPADMSEFKEGSDVICLGTYESGSVVMNATRIDLRKE